MRVLLSINPVHVENIRLGVKIFEFRRRIFARRDIRTVVMYCTKPVGRLVGEFDIAKIHEDSPEALWISTAPGSGISKDFFDAYFEGRSKAFALEIGETRFYENPIEPTEWFGDFTPPQSYMYVPSQIPSGTLTHQLEMFA